MPHRDVESNLWIFRRPSENSWEQRRIERPQLVLNLEYLHLGCAQPMQFAPEKCWRIRGERFHRLVEARRGLLQKVVDGLESGHMR
jgi:hypothetical protein